MRIFIPFLFTFVPTFVSADLRSDLKAANITALFEGDKDYLDESQAYNRRFTVKPAAVTFPVSAEQVAETVKIGAMYNHSVVARSGGHNYIANGLGGRDGAVVVDLRGMKQMTISDETATIQTGNRLGNVASFLNDAGRALPHGTCPYVGIGGHAAYGGFGFTSRKWGLNLDPIKSIQVVLANGTLTNTSAQNSSDLFWAMRGAAPSFGIATALTVQTFEVPTSVTVFEYTWRLNATTAARAVSSFQRFSTETDIPAEFGPEFVVTKGRYDGEVNLKLFGGWYRPAEEFNGVIAPYLGQVGIIPHITKLTVGSYIESVIQLGDKGTIDTSAPDTNDTFYAKSLMTPEADPIPDKAWEAFMAYAAHEGFETNLDWFVGIELFGGKNSAINSVPLDQTAFGHRDTLWTFQFYASSPNHNPPFPGGGLDFLNNMVKKITDNPPTGGWDIGAFPNYIDDGLQNYQQLYYGPHCQKLVTLKRKYDSKNVFSFTESIGPEGCSP